MKLKSKFPKYGLLGLLFLTFCVPLAAFAGPLEGDEIDAMQKLIDQQQADITAQSQQLKSQQQRLDDQQKALEALQTQLQTLVQDQKSDADADSTVSFSKQSDVEIADVSSDQEVPSVDDPATADSATADSTAPAQHLAKSNTHVNSDFLLLDSHPLDIPDDRGVFIYSGNQSKMFRIYGSIRTLAVYDNRQNFHAYDLNIPQVPVGDADVKDWNTDATIKTTKLGFQVGVKDFMSMLGEFDWKGTGDDDLRIRHLYMRSKHWLIGQHWTAMSTVPFLPLSIDSHSTSGHFGVRPTQIKYLGGGGNWFYQAALDYYQPKSDDFDQVGGSASNLLPNIIGNVSYARPWGEARVSAMLSSNKVKYNYANGNNASSSEAGLALMAGIRAAVTPNNTIKAHIYRASGNSQYGADYANGKYDMTLNPNTGEFQNIDGWGTQAALEHKWTPTLTTAIGAGYMSMDAKDFQAAKFFDHGYKALVNLFYRPGGWLRGLTMAGELEFAGQTTLDGSDGNTTRVSVLMYYDF
jgi:TolA-binding protein